MEDIVCGNCNQTLMQSKTESERFCPKGTFTMQIIREAEQQQQQ